MPLPQHTHPLVRAFGSLLGVVGLVAAPAATFAQTASALLREGDPLGTAGTITALNNPSVNHVGGFSIQVNTSNGESHIWGDAVGLPGAFINTEGTFDGYQQTAFESFNGFSDAGLACYGVTATEVSSGTTGLDGVFVDKSLILIQRQPVASMPGQFSVFNSRPGITGDGNPHWVGGISPTLGGATQNRVLFYGAQATPLLKGGDIIEGVALPHTTGNMDFDYRFSRLGTHFIIEAQVNSGSTTNDTLMAVDGKAVEAGGGFVREGSPVPASIGGLAGELWAFFDFEGVTEFEKVFVTGDTSAAVAVDEFVFSGGQIVLREGAVLTTPAGNFTLSGAIEGGYQNRQGDWAVTWDANNPSAVNVEVLVVNGAIVLKEGDIVDLNGDGIPEASSHLADFTGISALVMGPRDVSGNVTLYFTADVDTLGTPTSTDDTEALLRLTVPSGVANQPPNAVCQDVFVPIDPSCNAGANIDDGSADPEDDPIALDQNPNGPYGLGTTSVTLTVTDVQGGTDSCTANVTVTVGDAPLTLLVAPGDLSWSPGACNPSFDLVRGDLNALRANGGDFSVATLECLSNDHGTTTAFYGDSPPNPGEGWWFLVRRTITGGSGTYDSGAASQAGPRDAEIAASGQDCS